MHALDGSYEVHGHALTVDVSPCCWMYPGYKLQVQYRAEDNRSWGYANHASLTESTATRDDVQTLLEGQLSPDNCTACGYAHLYNSDPRGNRGHLCELCFIARLNGEFDQLNAATRDAVQRRDAEKKLKGWTHVADAWVHPPNGSDYQITVYFRGEPTDEQVKAALRKRRSEVLDDYQVRPL